MSRKEEKEQKTKVNYTNNYHKTIKPSHETTYRITKQYYRNLAFNKKGKQVMTDDEITQYLNKKTLPLKKITKLSFV